MILKWAQKIIKSFRSEYVQIQANEHCNGEF